MPAESAPAPAAPRQLLATRRPTSVSNRYEALAELGEQSTDLDEKEPPWLAPFKALASEAKQKIQAKNDLGNFYFTERQHKEATTHSEQYEVQKELTAKPKTGLNIFHKGVEDKFEETLAEAGPLTNLFKDMPEDQAVQCSAEVKNSLHPTETKNSQENHGLSKHERAPVDELALIKNQAHIPEEDECDGIPPIVAALLRCPRAGEG